MIMRGIIVILMLMGEIPVQAGGALTFESTLVKESNSLTDKTITVKDVEAALAYQKKYYPDIHEDALRVWKNFESGKTEPNYTYKFWARDIILWLRKERGLRFESEVKVGDVFRILYNKGYISKDSAILLTKNVWGLLISREGIPDMGRKPPLDKSSQQLIDERDV